MVVNEAMACGLPIICTDVAGCAADLVSSNGILVAVSKISELSDAMRDIATDPELRNRMSAESRRLIQDYSPQHCAEGIAKATLAAVPRGNNYQRQLENHAASTL
jgi:glycosyltransferase involved in cell wall biosynthesis